MDQISNIIIIAAIGLFIIILVDYMHHIAKMSYTRIAAITLPIWVIWVVMVYLVISY